MLSWKLWNALEQPPTRHPLFRHAYTAPAERPPWYVGCAQWLSILAILPIITFAGTVYGLGWVVGITGVIGREHTRRTYELLSLSSTGPLGMSWALATGFLYRHRTFRNINTVENLYARVLLMAFIIAGLGFFFDAALLAPDVFIGLALVLRIATLAVALVFAHVQALALCVLIGMAVPTFTTSRLNGQLYAAAAFVGAEMFTYLLTYLLGFSIIPTLFQLVGWAGFGADGAILVLRLILFIAIREAVIHALWHLLLERLNPDPADLHALLGARLRN